MPSVRPERVLGRATPRGPLRAIPGLAHGSPLWGYEEQGAGRSGSTKQSLLTVRNIHMRACRAVLIP